LDKKETTVATCAVSATATNAIPTKEATKGHAYERSLIERAQHGDEQAFATLFQLHKKRVYSVCLLMTKDIAEAEDLTQEAFLQVFRSVGSFRCDSAFSTWLYCLGSAGNGEATLSVSELWPCRKIVGRIDAPRA
jgi:hypothetical protein